MNTLFRGSFVEAAFTQEQIERTIALEIMLGVRNSPCTFIGDDKSDYKPVSLSIVRDKNRGLSFPVTF